MATVTTEKSTGWVTPSKVSQYTTNVNSGTCYAYTNLSNSRVIDGSYAYIPSSGGVNSSHKSPRVYFYGFPFNLPTTGTVEITEVLIRQRVMKNVYGGGIKDYIVKLKDKDSAANTGIGSNLASSSLWSEKTLKYQSYSYKPSSLSRSYVNDSGFGCIVQCVGTSSTWVTPAIDGVEMAIRYKHSVTVNPTYSQTQNLNTSQVKINGQKTNLTITQKNTNSTSGSFPGTTVTLSGGLCFSDGTTSKSIAAVNTSSGWSRTTTFSNIYCTKSGTGSITISNSVIGTKNLSVTMLPADAIIYPPLSNLNIDISGDFEDNSILQPGEEKELILKITGKSYTKSHITGLSVDINNIPFEYISINYNHNQTAVKDFAEYDYGNNELWFDLETTNANTQTGVNFECVIKIKFIIPWDFGEKEILIYDDSEILENNKIIHYNVLIHNILIEGYKRKISMNHFATVRVGDVFDAIGEKRNIISECSVTVGTQDPFIGVVTLKQSHGIKGLKNKTSNPLISKGYKNRRNMGKTGDYREDIPLIVLVPYEDAAVFQGMVDMDKPFPINTCLSAPDMDPFNHRGWVEIHDAELEYLNPSKTRVKLDVEYLTRNLNVPTTITRHEKLNPSITSNIGDLVLEQFNIDYANQEEEDYLFIDPDTEKPLPFSPLFVTGGQGLMNNDSLSVTLDEDEYYRFKTYEKISDKYEAEILWKIDFNKGKVDNILTASSGYVPPDSITYNVERSIKLVDSNNNPVFIYTLDNIMYEIERDPETEEVIDENVYGNITIHEFYENGDNTQFSETIEFPFGNSENGYADKYGLSTVTNITIENDQLVFSETGTIAKETAGDPVFQSEPTYLIPSDNFLVLENSNKSDDLSSSWDDILGPVPTVFQTLFNITEYSFSSSASNYTNMIVSPFPLIDKPLIFTRKCKDGLLYYYRFDGANPSSYYVQPNNMYKGGCDLTTEKGTSILTERYTVNPLCIDNGLVRCIFMKNLNRVNIYIFNPGDDETILRDPWIYITTIIVPNMNTVSPSNISDDKITIKTGDTNWTIYRGHYNIDIAHKSVDLKFLQKFDKIRWVDPFGDTIEDKLFRDTNYPFLNNFYHQFYNSNNDEGLMILRPNKDSIQGMLLPKSNKTVLIPYYKNTRVHNRPASLAMEWMYQYSQIIVAQGV